MKGTYVGQGERRCRWMTSAEAHSHMVEIGPLMVYVTNDILGYNTLVIDFSMAYASRVALNAANHESLWAALGSFRGMTENLVHHGHE